MIRALGHLRIFSLGGFLLALALVAAPAMARSAKSASPKSVSPAPPPALLPSYFGGWQFSGPTQQGDQPQAVDAANAAVLTECGFRQYESANYSSPEGKLSVRAIRFEDASGAYCGFTFYRRPGSLAEQVGQTAAWDGSHVLFWNGSTLVDATFDQVTAMSAAQLRELATDLPRPPGNENIAPSLPDYLPRQGLDADLIHYTLGPESYRRSGGVLPPALVDFGAGSAEAVTAAYTTRDGQGNLTLIEYPTPQLAEARLAVINAFLKAGNTPQAAWPQPLADSRPDALLTRRSGPILALTNGSFSAAEAHNLIDQVNYQANVIWNNPQGYIGEGAKVARLLVGIVALFAILGGAAITLGIFFGGGRALIRTLRGKPASSVDEVEFIRLNLEENPKPEEQRKDADRPLPAEKK